MEGFWKAACLILLTVLLGTAVGKTEKDISLVLTITACCMVLGVAAGYLGEVVGFFRKWTADLGLQDSILGSILQIAGVALVSEITGLISADAGNSSLAKAMEILGNAAILLLSLPMFQTFFTIMQDLLGLL